MTFTAGTAIPDTLLPLATGGGGNITYSIEPRLPPRLTFDSETRTLVGTPARAGEHNLRYVARAGDDSATLPFTIRVFTAAPSLASGGVYRANLDGSEGETLIRTEGTQPLGIAIHDGKMYWTDRGDDAGAGKIERANLDGSGRETLVSRSGLVRPISIAIGPAR